MEAHVPPRYRILRPLGRGGEGYVWLVADRLHGNARVALKALPRTPGAALDLELLSAEFLTLVRLAHPHVARVRDFGGLAHDHGAYFTSDYVQGANLLDWASGVTGEAKWAELMDVAAQALSVVRYLSLRGLCHGDLKPANLLVESASRDDGPAGAAPPRPTLKLIDFGTARMRAKLAPDATNGAANGAIAGTPAYLPPPGRVQTWDGGRVDLYSLGMSLFHAATGRLPYSVGDRAALEAWWNAETPAHARAMDPAVPPALDALIEGLTTVRGKDAYSSAGAALESLKSRIALPELRRPGGAEEAWFTGRESFVDSLLTEMFAPAGARRVHAITAPPGSGKTRVLELVAASLQARGVRTVLFRGENDPHGWRALRELLRGDASADGSAGQPVDIAPDVDALFERETAILLDDDGVAGRAQVASREAIMSRSTKLLRAFAREISTVRRRTGGARLVVAAASLESAARALGIDGRDLAEHRLEPLSARSVGEAIREYFSVEEAPAEIVALVSKASRGMPRLVREALDRLSEHGASCDFLGQLSIPRPLPARLVTSSASDPGVESLPASLRRALGLVWIAGHPLTAGAAAALLPELDAEAWSDRMERLRCRGFVRMEEGDAEPSYGAVLDSAGAALGRALLGDDELACRASLRVRQLAALSARASPSVEALLAAAGNSLALSDPGSAARFARRALRRSRSSDLDDALADLLGRILAAPRTAWNGRRSTARARRCVELRASQILTRLGRFDEALAVLATPASDAPEWYRQRVLWLRADAHERAGDAPAAIESLEALRDARRIPAHGDARGGSRAPNLDLPRSEASARLATLWFRCGNAEKGREHLEEGRRLLAAPWPAAGAEHGPLLARVLARFASAESAHGEAKNALRFLEEAVRIARRAGRDDLLLGPLNEIGIARGQERRWPEALAAFEEIERISRRQGDRMGALKSIYNRAIIHYRLHELDRAESLFRDARELSDSLGRHSLSSTIWLGFAGVLREKGRILQALRLYRRVLRRAPVARLNDRAVAHNNVSEIYLLLGRLHQAAMHANLAFRIARRTANRFLLALALRSRGRARFALGRERDAGRDLELAIDLARNEGDDRARGVACYYLGLAAGASGDRAKSVRCLRAARFWSRRASDVPHAQAATVALLGELEREGRSAAAKRILKGGDAAELSRGSLAARVLLYKLDGAWPASLPRALTACREEARRGNVWEAFCALEYLLRDRRLDEPSRGAILFELHACLQRLLRGLSARRAARFRSFWRTQPARAPDLAGGAAPIAVTSRSMALLHDAAFGEELLSALLEETLQELNAAAAWLLFDPEVDEKAYLRAGSEKTSPESLLDARAAAIEARVGPNVVFESGSRWLARAPHPKAVRFLCIEQRSGKGRDREVDRARLLEKTAVLGLVLHVMERDRELAREREQLAGARSEVRRLNALLVQDPHGPKQDLETALLTQGLKALDLRRELSVKDWRPRRAFVAASPKMRAIVDRLPRIAAQDIPVLLLGESGVGKDLLARRIHDLSPRRERPYTAEICNIAESLMEAELFGFVEGAFTGATAGRQGIFERASGGTLYLDEIAGLAPSLQARLLRVFEEKVVRPIGADRPVPVDFRLISSSSRSLDDLRESREFRPDLLYRIQGEVIVIPPLRERLEDLPGLVAELIAEHARGSVGAAPYLHPRALERLLDHDWPGNVRELENELARLLVSNPVEITEDMLFALEPRAAPKGPAPEGKVASLPSLKDEKRRVERSLLLRALTAHAGNANRAARALGVTRRYLGILLEKHAIRLEELKPQRAAADGKRPRARRTAPKSSGRRSVKGDLRNRRPSTH